jgi:hypothetical protein
MRNPASVGFGVLLGLILSTAGAYDKDCRIYDPDAAHLWNRLHETLFVRVAADGARYGCDRIDPLYWYTTKQTLAKDSHRAAIGILDKFLQEHGEKLIRDPLRRAFLQHDLWALFDWSTQNPHFEEYGPERKALQLRLAAVIRRLALSEREIAALPGNFASPPDGGPVTVLPDRLLDPEGPWIAVAAAGPVAPVHAQDFGGRSIFQVYLKLPEGRAATLSYLARLHAIDILWSPAEPNWPREEPVVLRPDLPQFPAGTQWVLVRTMAVLDPNANIRPTPVVESIQLRIYDHVPAGQWPTPDETKAIQRFQEFQSVRSRQGALRQVQPGELDFQFVLFRTMGGDPIQHANERGEGISFTAAHHDALRQCGICHAGSGVYSVRILVPLGGIRERLREPGLREAKPGEEAVATALWKRSQYDFGLLRGLWGRAD